jgi:hypothetical protein
MEIDKSKLKDTMGRPLTQALFLEVEYNEKYAYFTINDDDKTYKGKVYPSLKKMYMQIGDPTEYQFAMTCLLGWKHWQRMKANGKLATMFDEWAEELEVMLRSNALMSINEISEENFQAAKYITEKGWDKRSAGRPTKDKKEREDRIVDNMNADFADDFKRLQII